MNKVFIIFVIFLSLYTKGWSQSDSLRIAYNSIDSFFDGYWNYNSNNCDSNDRVIFKFSSNNLSIMGSINNKNIALQKKYFSTYNNGVFEFQIFDSDFIERYWYLKHLDNEYYIYYSNDDILLTEDVLVRKINWKKLYPSK